MQSPNVPYQPVNHVFVDFENVRTIDVAVVSGKNLTFHLFFGPHQKTLDIEVVEVLLKHAQVVQIVRSPKSGKNALDFVLAYHLGQAVVGDPKGYFHIVSKDAGFDALVDLLKSKLVKVKRHADWSGLNFNGPVKSEVEPKIAVAKALSEKAQNLLDDLKKVAVHRPKRKKGLLGRASSVLGKDSKEAQRESLVQELVKAGKLTLDEKGAVSYSL